MSAAGLVGGQELVVDLRQRAARTFARHEDLVARPGPGAVGAAVDRCDGDRRVATLDHEALAGIDAVLLEAVVEERERLLRVLRGLELGIVAGRFAARRFGVVSAGVGAVVAQRGHAVVGGVVGAGTGGLGAARGADQRKAGEGGSGSQSAGRVAGGG